MLGLSPYFLLGGVAALLATATGAFFIGDSHGADRVIAREAKAMAKAEYAATALAQTRQDSTHAADVAGTEKAALVAALSARGRDTTKEYYHENPAADRPCLPVERVQSIASADAAASVAAAASVVAGAVQHPAPAVASDGSQ